MELSQEEYRFLEILADGKRKTYVHIIRGFGLPLTPVAPTFTNKLAKRLLNLKLVEKAGLLRDGYRITPLGLQALRKHANG